MSERLHGEALLAALEAGELRVAERASDGTWKVHSWIRDELLVIFRASENCVHGDPQQNPLGTFIDKSALPVQRFELSKRVRIVPGGSSVRRGAHLAQGVIAMPPMYVNVGAFVGAGTMIDSHALVGSCAQIGGVLEPAQAQPVIVEDEAFIGGGCGLYEGVIVRRRAVLAAGVVLSASTRVFDLIHERELQGSRERPLEIPENAVVVSGARPASSAYGQRLGLQVHCALIVKYRDAKTDNATALEQALRG